MNQETLLKLLAEHGMAIDAWRGGAGQFRDLYIGIGKPYGELTLMQNLLVSNGCVPVGLTHVDNPEHKDYRKPMLEIKSYWWTPEGA